MRLEGFQDVLVIVTYGSAILILSVVADEAHWHGASSEDYFSPAASSIWHCCRAFAPNA
jgi:hypothetical protein